MDQFSRACMQNGTTSEPLPSPNPHPAGASCLVQACGLWRAGVNCRRTVVRVGRAGPARTTPLHSACGGGVSSLAPLFRPTSSPNRPGRPRQTFKSWPGGDGFENGAVPGPFLDYVALFGSWVLQPLRTGTSAIVGGARSCSLCAAHRLQDANGGEAGNKLRQLAWRYIAACGPNSTFPRLGPPLCRLVAPPRISATS